MILKKSCIFVARINKQCNNMPEICHFYGIVITMYLPDHNPPHFYVRYNGETLAKINPLD